MRGRLRCKWLTASIVTVPGERVVRVLEQLIQERGAPELTSVDNDPEFISRVLGDDGVALAAWHVLTIHAPESH